MNFSQLKGENTHANLSLDSVKAGRYRRPTWFEKWSQVCSNSTLEKVHQSKKRVQPYMNDGGWGIWGYPYCTEDWLGFGPCASAENGDMMYQSMLCTLRSYHYFHAGIAIKIGMYDDHSEWPKWTQLFVLRGH